jgi:hypothetical protein
MNKPSNDPSIRARDVVRRLLRAIDTVRAGARELEGALVALNREARCASQLRVIPKSDEEHDGR